MARTVFAQVILCSIIFFEVTSSVDLSESKRSLTKKPKCPDGYIRDLNKQCVKQFSMPKFEPCPEPELRFGTVEIKIRGRMSIFECEDGWDLAPDYGHAMCKLGQWDRFLPLCVRPGCETLATDSDVLANTEMDSAITRFTCLAPNMEIDGQPVLGCDGQYWNGTAPTCRVRTTTIRTTEQERSMSQTEQPRTSSREAPTLTSNSGLKLRFDSLLALPVIFVSLAQLRIR